jgi:hypothetical protein
MVIESFHWFMRRDFEDRRKINNELSAEKLEEY